MPSGVEAKRAGRPRVRRNVVWGLTWGVGLAAAYSLIGGFAIAIQGVLPIQRTGFTLTQVLALYWAAGIGGGVVVGLLRPWTYTHLGAVVVGALVFVPFGIAIGLVVAKFELWAVLAGGTVWGVLLGGSFGSSIWREQIRERHDP